MIAVALLAYAALLVLFVAPVMSRYRAFDRAPNLGILAWQVLVASTLLSVVLGGLSLLVPSVPVSTGLADFLEACAMLIQHRYATPAGAALGATGLVLVLAVTGRTGYYLVKAARQARIQRRAHQDTLSLVGRCGPEGVTLLEHAAPAAYCLPGRQGRVVLTTGALGALSGDQLRAVLAHERAHLRCRHHLVLEVAGAVTSAFPRSRTFRTARAEIARLIELAADDAAVGRTSRFTLAEALLTLNSGESPAATLAAGGSTAAGRVRRLIDAQPPLRLLPSVLGVGLALATLAVPLTMATSPALAAMGAGYCPVDSATWQAQLAVFQAAMQGPCQPVPPVT